MVCTICKTGKTKPGLTTVTLQRGMSTIVIKKVKAQICDNCSEYYLDEDIAEKVYKIADDAESKGAEVEITSLAV